MIQLADKINEFFQSLSVDLPPVTPPTVNTVLVNDKYIIMWKVQKHS